ncbi:MAG TPA: dockerin type I domain-containing protein, partial [Fimbriimonadaceae bacterium]|nr:dockerin type I domain-containing protein [Fimbriimonadaceae bacterium]
ATVNTTTGARISELGWSGSGGGWSNSSFGTTNFNTLPSWQVGTGVPTTINHRLVPDIAAQADGSGGAFYLFYNGGLYGVNGTSCSSPYLTSSFATLEQRLALLGLTVAGPAGRLGRVANLIYAMNGRADVWYDVTSGSSNGTLPSGATSNAAVGWDFETGWGAPNFDALYNVLATRPVSGTVTLQNYPPGPTGVTVTVKLYQAGTSILVDTQTTTLNSSGAFTVNSQAPSGNYDIYVKTSHWLRKKVTNQSFGLNGVSGLAYSLPNGDVNGDNSVSLADFGQLKLAYGSTSSSGNWNPNADLDGNGSVGLSDFGILKLNYGKSGD